MIDQRHGNHHALAHAAGKLVGIGFQSHLCCRNLHFLEDLQRDRGETVYLLTELVKQVPEGVYLKSLKQEGGKVNITGYAQSNARVSALMRNIEASPWLENPQLIEVKSVVLNGRRSNEFAMNFTLTRTQPDVGKGKK